MTELKNLKDPSSKTKIMAQNKNVITNQYLESAVNQIKYENMKIEIKAGISSEKNALVLNLPNKSKVLAFKNYQNYKNHVLNEKLY
jgi:type IV secretory pathway VirB4 component